MSVSTAPEQHVLLHGIRWETYEQMLADLADRQVRLTYDRGALEIMSPSRRHERMKKLLGRMIEAMTLELGVPIQSGGSTTWRRRDLEKGLEPDECYWVQSEARVRDREELDLRVDPPPDLAVEVDVRSSSLDRMAIYAALGVGEVWRYGDGGLAVHVLEGGGYRVQERSRCFPWLPVAEFAAFLGRRRGTDETTWMRSFVEWVRGSLRPGQR